MSDITNLEVLGDGIYSLTMQDEEHQNIFRDEFIDAVTTALGEAGEKDDIKVLVLRGLISTFAGGADRKNLLQLADGTLHVKDLILSEKLLDFPVPIIGAAEGHAVGGGFVMLMCCDLVVIAEQSRYGANFMNMGFTPGMGCTTLLPMLVGEYVAAEMMYTGKRFKGRELKGRTNINYIVMRQEVFRKAHDLAMQISEKEQFALQQLKNSLSLPKRHALIDARNREDMMHRLTFGAPGVRQRIIDTYGR